MGEQGAYVPLVLWRKYVRMNKPELIRSLKCSNEQIAIEQFLNCDHVQMNVTEIISEKNKKEFDN